MKKFSYIAELKIPSKSRILPNQRVGILFMCELDVKKGYIKATPSKFKYPHMDSDWIGFHLCGLEGDGWLYVLALDWADENEGTMIEYGVSCDE